MSINFNSNQPNTIDKDKDKGTKRPRETSESPQHKVAKQMELPEAEYLLIYAKEGKDNRRLNPFNINRTLKQLNIITLSSKHLRSGMRLLQLQNPKDSAILQQQTTIAGISVVIEPHRTLNTSRGVINSSEFEGMEDNELLEELQDYGVTNARRIITRRNGKPYPTNSIVLTFNKPRVPKTLFCAYLSLPVKPYLPMPLRCFSCQKFGHNKFNCKSKPRCANCGEDDHTNNCENASTCINCQLDHPAYSKDCPAWQQEKNIIYIKVTENVSFQEARKRVEDGHVIPGKTYAQSTKNTTRKRDTRSIATQTDASTQTEFTPHVTPSKLPVATVKSPTPSGLAKKPTKMEATPSEASSGRPISSAPPTTKSGTKCANNTALKQPPKLPPPKPPKKPAQAQGRQTSSAEKRPKTHNNRFEVLDDTNYLNVSAEELPCLSSTSLSVVNAHNKQRYKDNSHAGRTKTYHV